MKRISLILFILVIVAKVFALDPPKLVCAELLDNGRLKVTWNNPEVDCDKFSRYDFYINDQYVDHLDKKDICGSSSRDLTLTNQAASYVCIIKAYDAGNTSYLSNTLTVSPKLTITVSPDTARAMLTWTEPGSVMDDQWDDYYVVYRKRYYDNQFDSIARVPRSNPQYTDTSDVCYGDIYYQIGMSNRYVVNGNQENCRFKSTVEKDFFVDRFNPKTPCLDSVTTTEDNEIQLGFHAVEERMMAFIIYYDDAGRWVTIDTIYDATDWIDPSGKDRCYRIAVLDSCVNSSTMTSLEQCNMKLTLGNTDICHNTASISWTAYTNLWGGVDHYEIFLSTDDGLSYQSAGTTQGLSQLLTGLLPNTDYRAFIRVYNADGSITASSNRIDFKLDAESSVDMTYIRSVSVVDNQYVDILVHTSGDTLPFNSIVLERSEDGVNFAPIETQAYQSLSGYEFVDNNADFAHKVYYYRTYIINSCDQQTGYSNVSHNILLSGEATAAITNLLYWNDYDNWDGGVDHYKIFKKYEINEIFGEDDHVIVGANTFEEDVSELFHTGSKFSYYVRAFEARDKYGFTDISNSNYIELQQSPSTYLPNAFTPNGDYLNEKFMPVNTFVPTDSYHFSIYTRTGVLVFETTNPYDGWDGTFNGRELPTGVYVYKLTYLLPDKNTFKKTGTVTLLR